MVLRRTASKGKAVGKQLYRRKFGEPRQRILNHPEECPAQALLGRGFLSAAWPRTPLPHPHGPPQKATSANR